MKSELAAWLLQVLKEDRAEAQAAAEVYGPTWITDEYSDGVTGATGGYVACGPYDGDLDRELRHHIARHDPAAVLADIEAKVAVVEVLAWQRERQHVASDDMVIRVMATAYASRPGYRDEWWPADEWKPRP